MDVPNTQLCHIQKNKYYFCCLTVMQEFERTVLQTVLNAAQSMPNMTANLQGRKVTPF
jgi:hypothetical protein